MNKEEIKIKEFNKQQLEILLNDLQDIDKFTGFKDGAFKYELGKYQANLLVGCIKKYKEVIDNTIERCKYLLENNEVTINGEKYYKQSCDDIITNYLLESLESGDSNE